MSENLLKSSLYKSDLICDYIQYHTCITLYIILLTIIYYTLCTDQNLLIDEGCGSCPKLETLALPLEL